MPGTLSEQAYLLTRQKILKGDLPLGAAISRRKLAEEFKMSFLPVSEAIRRLEHEGLVESRPRVGTRVRIPSAQDVRDRCIMREALEAQAARLFAEKASCDERSELRGMAAHLEAMVLEACTGEVDADALFRLQTYHFALHMRIAECSGCATLCEALGKTQVLIFNWLYDAAAHHRILPGSHLQLVGAVGGRDVETAEAAMRQHVRFGLEDIQAEIAARFVPAAAILSGLEHQRNIRSAPQRTSTWRVKSISR